MLHLATNVSHASDAAVDDADAAVDDATDAAVDAAVDDANDDAAVDDANDDAAVDDDVDDNDADDDDDDDDDDAADDDDDADAPSERGISSFSKILRCRSIIVISTVKRLADKLERRLVVSDSEDAVAGGAVGEAAELDERGGSAVTFVFVPPFLRFPARAQGASLESSCCCCCCWNMSRVKTGYVQRVGSSVSGVAWSQLAAI